MSDLHYDLCVIGGGINGAGIARDAAGRGLSVLLIETQDLAGATSSASTKLIHGGLRYLEHREFGLVRKALKERERLYRTAQHLIWPITCVLPQGLHETRPEWMIRLGLWIYDHLGGRSSLPRSRVIDRTKDNYVEPLKSDYIQGFVYSDCWCDDTRLVIANAVDAAARGAEILTHTECTDLNVEGGVWRVGLREVQTGHCRSIQASMVVNATGPWVSRVLERTGLSEGDPDAPQVRMVKGSHLIINRHYEGQQAYVLQQDDGRIVFVAPYEKLYTVIGTTEEEYEGNPRDVYISQAEKAYLIKAFNGYFERSICEADVVFTYSGVRPLMDDGGDNVSAVSRDHVIYHHKRYDPPMLSLFGGKLTTYRAVAEDVVDVLMRLSGRAAPAWTADVALSGADYKDNDFDAFVARKQHEFSWVPASLMYRYARAYGTRMDYFLSKCTCLADMGVDYGDDVYRAELEYLRDYEWARSAEDVIWRRSKLGMCISEQTIAAIDEFFNVTESVA